MSSIFRVLHEPKAPWNTSSHCASRAIFPKRCDSAFNISRAKSDWNHHLVITVLHLVFGMTWIYPGCWRNHQHGVWKNFIGNLGFLHPQAFKPNALRKHILPPRCRQKPRIPRTEANHIKVGLGQKWPFWWLDNLIPSFFLIFWCEIQKIPGTYKHKMWNMDVKKAIFERQLLLLLEVCNYIV